MRTWQKLSRPSLQDELASDGDFLLYESPKKKLNSTLESIVVSAVNIHVVAQHSYVSNAKCKLKNVLNVYKENISAAYNVSDLEIEPPPIYGRDTKNEAEELERLHDTMKEKLITDLNTEDLYWLWFVSLGHKHIIFMESPLFKQVWNFNRMAWKNFSLVFVTWHKLKNSWNVW